MDEGEAQKPNQQFIASVSYNKDYCQMNESQKRYKQSGSKSTNIITAHWLLLSLIIYFIIPFPVTWQTCSFE